MFSQGLYWRLSIQLGGTDEREEKSGCQKSKMSTR